MTQTTNQTPILTSDQKDIIKTLAKFDGLSFDGRPADYLFNLKYLTNLDLLHQIESKLSTDQWYRYIPHLLVYLPETGSIDLTFLKNLLHQSAANRSLALYKTLN